MGKADKVHRGITWLDFPMVSKDTIARKLAFAEFCRGTHALCAGSVGLEGEALKLRLQELAGKRRRQFGRIVRRALFD